VKRRWILLSRYYRGGASRKAKKAKVVRKGEEKGEPMNPKLCRRKKRSETMPSEPQKLLATKKGKAQTGLVDGSLDHMPSQAASRPIRTYPSPAHEDAHCRGRLANRSPVHRRVLQGMLPYPQ